MCKKIILNRLHLRMFVGLQNKKAQSNRKNLYHMRLIILSTLLLLPFVSFGQNANNNKYTNDSVVNINMNEEFELNFTTFLDGGFKWFLESNDSTKIKLIRKTSQSPPNVSDTLNKIGVELIGGGSTETWKFVGLKQGVYKMHFYYSRPNQNEFRRTRSITVIIS